MLVKAKSIEIGPENAVFWIEKDAVIGDRVIYMGSESQTAR